MRGAVLKAMQGKIHTSFEADAFLGASFTLPEGPFGREKIPASAPCAMARLS